MSYEQSIHERILTPLDTAPCELGFEIDTTTSATGYHRRRSLSYCMLGLFLDKSRYMAGSERHWRAFPPFYVNGAAYGGLIGTADGFARYVQALLTSSSPLLSESSRRLLLTENVLRGGTPSGMAMACFRGELDGQTYFAHAGGGGGYYCEVRIYPEIDRGSVIMFNRSGLKDERILDHVDRRTFQAEAGL